MNKGNWFWPDVSDIDGAKNAARLGVWCASIVALMTTLIVVAILLGARVPGFEASALVDAALFAAIAYGISKYSRIAAAAGFVLFLVEKIYALKVTGNFFAVGVLGVVILFGLFNGMRGCFAYHKYKAAAAAAGALPPAAPLPPTTTLPPSA